MVRIQSYGIGLDHNGQLPTAEPTEAEQDPVTALHDTDEETGDEAGLADTFSMDSDAARERGVDLDPVGRQEPELDLQAARR
jgi:hypothetical protein